MKNKYCLSLWKLKLHTEIDHSQTIQRKQNHIQQEIISDVNSITVSTFLFLLKKIN